jgi:hypothetical protein
VEDALAEIQGDVVRVVIDYSSMTRAWSWSLLNLLHRLSQHREIRATLVYSPAQYSPPPTPTVITKFGPIEGLMGALEPPERPIGLVIGLGYERDRALGVVEYIDPAVTWAFQTAEGKLAEFAGAVAAANRELMAIIGKESVFRYRLDDFVGTAAAVNSLLQGATENYRVIVAPLGPKPFAIVAYLLSLSYPGVDVWRVSSGPESAPQERIALGPVFGATVVFAP